jgi:hypothetical protein
MLPPIRPTSSHATPSSCSRRSTVIAARASRRSRSSTIVGQIMTHRKLRPSRTSSSRRDYRPPTDIGHAALSELLRTSCRAQLEEKQLELLRNGDLVELYFAGDLSLVDRPCVAIVGSRAVSLQGRFRSERLARELAAPGSVVVSGLGLGVDTAALPLPLRQAATQ